MKYFTIQVTAVTLSASLLFTGCSGMTPGESAASVGSVAGVAAGLIGSAAGLNSGQAAALGAGVGLAAAGITYAIAKHQADERQRQVAEENARRLYLAQSAERKAAIRRRSRYIAVRTSRNSQSTGKASCMVFDTEKQQVVGNTVYDCRETPQTGSTAKFDSYNATYVGG
ncbi:MAG: hypothetical protein JO295_02445 [Verrucomicrobia bacterium]|nr:hypothetical protein [Verrucomicrobiota bacterium]